MDERKDQVFGSRERGGRPVATVRPNDFEPAKVKFLHKDGYGFVERENGKPDAYFHVERLDDDVRHVVARDLQVMVAVGSGKRGPVVLALRL